MLRDVPPPTEHVSKTYPIFTWQFCQCCRKEFLREWGWKYVYAFGVRIACYHYICHACGEDSKEYAGDLAYRLKYQVRKRPTTLPVPPPSVIRKESQER